MDSVLAARFGLEDAQVDQLEAWLRAAGPLVIVTGAGCSTASGIPEYRDATGRWKGAEPIQYRHFLAEPSMRKRYWARSLNGFSRLASAAPNRAHEALAKLESLVQLDLLITQNVDGLHTVAGSERVLELHGNLRTVVCLCCGAKYHRGRFQRELERLNPAWLRSKITLRPDGDAALEANDYDDFEVPVCRLCHGTLKPDVVFFGETIPKHRKTRALAAVRQAQAILVVGSSLMVLSGFRLVREAHAQGKRLALINLGVTRADDWFDLRINARCEAALDELLRRHSAEPS